MTDITLKAELDRLIREQRADDRSSFIRPQPFVVQSLNTSIGTIIDIEGSISAQARSGASVWQCFEHPGQRPVLDTQGSWRCRQCLRDANARYRAKTRLQRRAYNVKYYQEHKTQEQKRKLVWYHEKRKEKP